MSMEIYRLGYLNDSVVHGYFNIVTKKIEDALSGLAGVNSIRSTSRENISSVIIELEQNANIQQNSSKDLIGGRDGPFGPLDKKNVFDKTTFTLKI